MVGLRTWSAAELRINATSVVMDRTLLLCPVSGHSCVSLVLPAYLLLTKHLQRVNWVYPARTSNGSDSLYSTGIKAHLRKQHCLCLAVIG